MLGKAFSAAICAALGLTLLATPAGAKSPPVTKMKFKLDAHEVVAGAQVTGGVSAWTHDGNTWAPLDADLTVKVDGLEVGIVTTDAGYADVAYTVEVGEHVMKVVFPGDDLHKRAQRAQGFEVTVGAPVPAATAPGAPTLTGASPSAAPVHLEWTDPASDGGSVIIGYKVYAGATLGGEVFLADVPAGTLAMDDASVVSGTTVYYVVTAVNVIGESVWSNEVTVAVT